MERWQAKLLALVGTFAFPLCATLLPYKVSGYVSKKGKKGKLVLSYLMCFGGGIFFGTYLLHMGPEVHLLLDTALLVPYGIQYPLTDLFIGIGFFFVLFSEKFVLKWNKRRIRNRSTRKEATEKAETTRGAKKEVTANADCCANCVHGTPCSLVPDPKAPPVGFVEPVLEGYVDDDCFPDKRDRFHGNRDADGALRYGKQSSDADGVYWERDGEGNRFNGSGVGYRSTKEEEAVGYSAVLLDSGKPPTDDDDDEQQNHHNHHHNTRSIILILALSMHRIFEGMTIGLQSSLHNIWSLFVAVMCHEVVIGFSLGLQLVKSRLSLRRMTITSLVCSAIMPLGVAVGIVLTELGSEDGKLAMANGILQAVAMGTFIYVTFFEILQEEVDPNDTSLGKIFFIFAGFAMMALLDLIPEETMTGGRKIVHEPVLCNGSFTTMTQPTLLANLSLSL